MGTSRRQARAIVALKFGFAAIVLALVMVNLPWTDEAIFADHSGERVFSGAIVGDWKSARVRFVFAADIMRGDLPTQWRARLVGVNMIDLARSAGDRWRAGMPRLLATVQISGLLLALLFVLLSVLGATTRWWRLLSVVGCPTRWLTALRLTLYGQFFSLVVPGLTGGDVIKAVLAAREHPERRAAAATSVLIDRLVGILMLAFVAAVVILIVGEKFRAVRAPVLLLFGGGIVAALTYTNPALRRALNVTYWLGRVPMAASLRQIDTALLANAQRQIELLLAVLISLWNHACAAFAVLALGRAFGDRILTLLDYFAVSSIGNIVAALPISPGGWGVGEATYQFLFELVGGDGAIGVAASIAFKLMLAFIGLWGGVFLLFPEARREVLELREIPGESSTKRSA